MIKVVDKGYTLRVTSWENDGDYSKTKSKTFETKEEAIRAAKLCKELFVSCNRSSVGVGNCTRKDVFDDRVSRYIQNNPNIFLDQSNMTIREILDRIDTINTELLGSSEDYFSRVFDSLTLVYSPEDVYLQEIEVL